MGLFDDVMGKAAAALGGSGDSANPLMSHVTDLINEHGGVAGLAQTFRDRGLGATMASWISTGQNLPISSEQIQSVLGGAQVQELAGKAGISPEMLKSGLATLLPMVIDKMTPDGQLPPS